MVTDGDGGDGDNDDDNDDDDDNVWWAYYKHSCLLAKVRDQAD